MDTVKTPELFPEYKNDNHIVEKRAPLCEICIEADRKATIVPIGHLERRKAEQSKQDRIDEQSDHINSLTATVSSLTATVSSLQSQLAAVLARLTAAGIP